MNSAGVKQRLVERLLHWQQKEKAEGSAKSQMDQCRKRFLWCLCIFLRADHEKSTKVVNKQTPQ